MAENQTTVALNIGSQRIGMAVFEVSKNDTLILKAYDSATIVADPALDASKISQTRVAISDLVQRLKVGKTKARYAISGQSVFTRFVKLPPLQDDNIEQLVTFEAQQHVPFPLAEVVWDYELIEGADDKEVVIVAIKADSLDELNSAVNDSGLGTSEVDVAPMAIYNAFRATYGNPEEPILLIDIGAKTSNLLYIEGRRFFTRSIAIGGGAVTAAIAKEYGIPFMEAEHQKISNGLVALGGGHTEQMDEAVAALAMVIRNALTRLPAEIARTTNYYRSQHAGSAPRRVLLAGGGANLPYTLEFFQEKLNLPVEYFNPVRNVTIGKGVDAAVIQREGHLMGELVGLGLRGVGKDIEQLLGREDSLRRVASGYTDAEMAHGYWMDVLAELRGAFASDAVWITDFEPLHAYDPLAAGPRGAKPEAKALNGKSVIKNEFVSTAYGQTSLVDLKPEQAAAPQGNKPGAAVVTANAVRIKGFWRTGTSQNVVSELLKTLREKSSMFRFKVKDPKGADIVLSDDRLLDISVVGKPGELGLPFEITLPLVREIPIK